MLARVLIRNRYTSWARAWAIARMGRAIATEGRARIAGRCVVRSRVCMEEVGLDWQDCPMVGCGPPEVLSRADILAGMPWWQRCRYWGVDRWRRRHG